MNSLSQRIAIDHPVFGDDYYKLSDSDIISLGDQTAFVSCLLSLDGCVWDNLTEKYFAKDIGKTVAWHRDNSDDIDRKERVFRRKKK